MEVKVDDKTRCPRSSYVAKYRRCCSLLVCLRFIADPSLSIQAFTIISYSTSNNVHIKSIDSVLYSNHQANTIRKAKNQLDDADELDDDETETPTNSQRRLARVRNRVKDLARKMVQVPIHVASSITPMPQAVAAVLKDATFNAVDLAVEEGMYV
jgi:hypothetical protein